MHRAMKKVILLVALTLAFTGCSKNTPAQGGATPQESPSQTPQAQAPIQNSRFNGPGQFPILKETAALSILIPELTPVEDFETNTMTKLLEEKGNFDLSFVTLPQKEFHTKLNLMVAAGGDELPDIVMEAFSDSAVYNYALSGSIVPVTKYYSDPELAFYSFDAMERTGVDYRSMITSPDGEIYGLARMNQSISNEYPAKLYMYSKWMEALGLKDPTTPDEFYQVLKAFKTQDPNDNKQPDEIPLVGHTGSKYWIEYLMNPFVYAGDSHFFTVTDGQVGLAYNTEAWREGLRYMYKLVSEDLLSPLSFTQDSIAYYAMMNNPETIMGSFIQMGPSGISKDNPRRVEYKGVAPLVGSNGTQYASYVPGVASVAMVITKNCKDPEAAFKLGDLLASEEFSIMTRWGEKGVDYLEPKEGDKSLYDIMGYKPSLVEVSPWGQRQNKHWYNQSPYIRHYAISAGVVWGGDPLDANIPIANAQLLYTGKQPEEVIPKLIYTPEESEAVSEILITLDAYVMESLASFATGGMSLDTDWDSYLKQLEAIGTDKVLEIVQKVYDRLYK